MLKKSILFCVILMAISGMSHAFEFGLSLGSMNKTLTGSGLHYSLTGGTGFLVPMLKLELEYYHRFSSDDAAGAGIDDSLNGLSIAVKFRPKFGKLSPYVVAGIGSEFDKFGVDFGEFDKFTFIGGGIHFYLMELMSLRADFRFMSFSADNRVRFSAGVFFHL